MNTTLFFKRTFGPAAPKDPNAAQRPPVSPSLRLQVTAANRALLRWMRAAELAAWEEPAPATRRVFRWFRR